ncbi:hypothetical protein PM082_004587 [Marasmius tenuissimus]|nr:hypothetical protein PM082_004587 [Marasmius tenuissimus]
MPHFCSVPSNFCLHPKFAHNTFNPPTLPDSKNSPGPSTHLHDHYPERHLHSPPPTHTNLVPSFTHHHSSTAHGKQTHNRQKTNQNASAATSNEVHQTFEAQKSGILGGMKQRRRVAAIIPPTSVGFHWRGRFLFEMGGWEASGLRYRVSCRLTHLWKTTSTVYPPLPGHILHDARTSSGSSNRQGAGLDVRPVRVVRAFRMPNSSQSALNPP